MRIDGLNVFVQLTSRVWAQTRSNADTLANFAAKPSCVGNVTSTRRGIEHSFAPVNGWLVLTTH